MTRNSLSQPARRPTPTGTGSLKGPRHEINFRPVLSTVKARTQYRQGAAKPFHGGTYYRQGPSYAASMAVLSTDL